MVSSIGVIYNGEFSSVILNEKEKNKIWKQIFIFC